LLFLVWKCTIWQPWWSGWSVSRFTQDVFSQAIQTLRVCGELFITGVQEIIVLNNLEKKYFCFSTAVKSFKIDVMMYVTLLSKYCKKMNYHAWSNLIQWRERNPRPRSVRLPTTNFTYLVICTWNIILDSLLMYVELQTTASFNRHRKQGHRHVRTCRHVSL
jgi:hypothetical protein